MSSNITVKNIPTDLYEGLKARAAENHRSLNAEIIALIAEATRSRRIDAAEMLVLARRLRRRSQSGCGDADPPFRLHRIPPHGRG